MKVKIVADGSSRGTRIIDANGNDISSMLAAVEFRHQAPGVPEMRLDLVMTVAVIEGEAKFIGHNGKEIRRVEYVDGTEDVF